MGINQEHELSNHDWVLTRQFVWILMTEEEERGVIFARVPITFSIDQEGRCDRGQIWNYQIFLCMVTITSK